MIAWIQLILDLLPLVWLYMQTLSEMYTLSSMNVSVLIMAHKQTHFEF